MMDREHMPSMIAIGHYCPKTLFFSAAHDFLIELKKHIAKKLNYFIIFNSLD